MLAQDHLLMFQLNINENQKEFINKNEIILKKLGRINNILR